MRVHSEELVADEAGQSERQHGANREARRDTFMKRNFAPWK